MSLHPPFADGPAAVVIGCGDLAMACARKIGQRHPLLLADIDPTRLDAAAAALRAEGYAVGAVACDITDRESLAPLAAAASPNGVRALLHVAALAPSANDFRRIMAVNLIGPHLVAEALLPLCVPGSAVVLVASLAGHGAQSDETLDAILDNPLQPAFLDRIATELGPERATTSQAYVFSKYALIRHAERLAAWWGSRGVRVLSVSPGLILSAMGARERAYNPMTAALAAKTPLRREASIQEIAAIIDFAASDAASFLTGVDILVDGGLRAAGRWPE